MPPGPAARIGVRSSPQPNFSGSEMLRRSTNPVGWGDAGTPTMSPGFASRVGVRSSPQPTIFLSYLARASAGRSRDPQVRATQEPQQLPPGPAVRIGVRSSSQPNFSSPEMLRRSTNPVGWGDAGTPTIDARPKRTCSGSFLTPTNGWSFGRLVLQQTKPPNHQSTNRPTKPLTHNFSTMPHSPVPARGTR